MPKKDKKKKDKKRFKQPTKVMIRDLMNETNESFRKCYYWLCERRLGGRTR